MVIVSVWWRQWADHTEQGGPVHIGLPLGIPPCRHTMALGPQLWNWRVSLRQATHARIKRTCIDRYKLQFIIQSLTIYVLHISVCTEQHQHAATLNDHWLNTSIHDCIIYCWIMITQCNRIIRTYVRILFNLPYVYNPAALYPLGLTSASPQLQTQSFHSCSSSQWIWSWQRQCLEWVHLHWGSNQTESSCCRSSCTTSGHCLCLCGVWEYTSETHCCYHMCNMHTHTQTHTHTHTRHNYTHACTHTHTYKHMRHNYTHMHTCTSYLHKHQT